MSTETHWWPRGDIKGGEEVTVWLVDDVLNLGIRKVQGHRCFGFTNLVNSNMETYSSEKYKLDEGPARLHAEHLRVEALRKARQEVERLERMEF
jgi:hypothetical protein